MGWMAMPFRDFLRAYNQTFEWDRLSVFGESTNLIEEGKLLLGCEGRRTNNGFKYDFKKPVYIPFDVNSESPPSILVIGKKGYGKTIEVMNLVSQFYYDFRMNCFLIDPKANLFTHKFPQQIPENIVNLNKANIQPRGLPKTLISPKMFTTSTKFKYTDRFYSITMKDFDRIADYSIKKDLVMAVLGLKDSDPSQRKLGEIMTYSPKTFKDMFMVCKHINEDEKKGWKRVSIFDNALKQKISEGVVSDTDDVDIVGLMQDSVVVLQCSLSPTEEVNSTFVAFALAQIKDGLESKKLSGKTLIVIDEGDVLAPSGISNPPSKQFCTQLYTKWRSDGAVPLVIAQDPGNLTNTILQQVDYVLTPAIGYGTSESKFIAEHFPSVNPYRLTMLDCGLPGEYPKQYAVIDPNQHVRTFYPLPPYSAHYYGNVENDMANWAAEPTAGI